MIFIVDYIILLLIVIILNIYIYIIHKIYNIYVILLLHASIIIESDSSMTINHEWPNRENIALFLSHVRYCAGRWNNLKNYIEEGGEVCWSTLPSEADIKTEGIGITRFHPLSLSIYVYSGKILASSRAWWNIFKTVITIQSYVRRDQICISEKLIDQ